MMTPAPAALSGDLRCRAAPLLAAAALGTLHCGGDNASVEGAVCSANLSVRLPDPSVVPAVSEMAVRILEGPAEVYSTEVDVFQSGGTPTDEIILGAEDNPMEEPARVGLSDRLRVEMYYLDNSSPAGVPPIAAIGRTPQFACLGRGRVDVPAFVGRANGFTTVTPEAPLQYRVGALATALADGRVLVVGGEDASAAPVTETLMVYDHATQTLCGSACLAGAAVPARVEHSVTQLGDGRVLILGGRAPGSGALMGDAYLFDPASDTVFELTGLGLEPVARHAAVLLNGANVDTSLRGRVLLAGGRRAGQASSALVLVDPAQGTADASSLPPLARARQEPGVALASSGEVAIFGGRDAAGALLADLEIFVASSGDAEVGSLRSSPAVTLRAARAGHSVTELSDGNFLVWGGETAPIPGGADPEPVGEVLVLTPQLGFLPVLGSETAAARFGHSATRLPCNATQCPVLIAGGQSTTLGGVASALFTPGGVDSQGNYVGALGALPSDAPLGRRIGHSAAALSDGNILIFGGRSSDPAAATTLIEAAAFAPCHGGDAPRGTCPALE